MKNMTNKETSDSALPAGFRVISKTVYRETIVDIGKNFSLRISNHDDGPDWYMALVDFDENIGARGLFRSESEAFARIGDFLDVAMPAYRAKHAKYGKMPTITVNPDGSLVMKLRALWPMDEPDAEPDTEAQDAPHLSSSSLLR